MTREANNTQVDNELTLIDMWGVLVRFKLAIFVTVVVTTCIGVGFSLLMPRVFESRTAIVIGKIDQVGLIEEPAVMVQRLIEEYKVNDNDEADKQLPYIDSVSIDAKNSNNIIEIKALGNSNEQASQLLHQVEQQIIDLHTASYIRVVGERRTFIEKLNKQFNEMETFIGLMETQAQEIRKREPVQASILSIEGGKLLSLKITLLQHITNLESSLSEIQTRPTAVLRQPTLPINPKAPRPFLYTSLAGAAGIMLGVFIAFVADLFAKLRIQKNN